MDKYVTRGWLGGFVILLCAVCFVVGYYQGGKGAYKTGVDAMQVIVWQLAKTGETFISAGGEVSCYRVNEVER